MSTQKIVLTEVKDILMVEIVITTDMAGKVMVKVIIMEARVTIMLTDMELLPIKILKDNSKGVCLLKDKSQEVWYYLMIHRL